MLSIQHYLTEYFNRWPAENGYTFPTAWNRWMDLSFAENAFLRTHLPGHFTGSAFIVSPDRKKTLLVHHAKLNRWLQPGGHADGDRDLLNVALREAQEETGLPAFKVPSRAIFDLDIHPIPARTDFPGHDHYDVRFLLIGNPGEKVVVSEESHDVKWVELGMLETYSTEPSLLRMRDKLAHPLDEIAEH